MIMERSEDPFLVDGLHVEGEVEGDGGSVLTANLVLDLVGEVVLTLNPNGLSWKVVETPDNELSASSCLGRKSSRTDMGINFSDVYAVEFINWGLIHELTPQNASPCLPRRYSEMYHFTVHAFQRSKKQPSLWVPVAYTFAHEDLNTCQIWVNRIEAFLSRESERPKSLLVLVNPRSGKQSGYRVWETVAPIFFRAKVKTKVMVTQRAGHAFDLMVSMPDQELSSYDGVLAVGGDGFFNEILNGLLLSRHKAPYPPAPNDLVQAESSDTNVLVFDSSAKNSDQGEVDSPLLLNSGNNLLQLSKSGSEDGYCNIDQDPYFQLPNEQFRFGIIPAGSTDAIVITTGARDPVTSALHIVLGKRVSLDIAQVIRWKKTALSKVEPFIRYAASFAGYGFYGDVITESEKYRWMGPVRYDYAGTKVFLRHRSYEAEVTYLEVKPEVRNSDQENAILDSQKKSERLVCKANCSICNTRPDSASTRGVASPNSLFSDKSRWLRSKGRFLSIGAAIISCRNEKAPDGLTPAFTFTSYGDESVWNVDGEMLRAHQLSAQVFRGLISLFATGPDT
ncbi:Diacylglycerol kinase, catalytic domain [Dillenia turbinata]|uniref:Diacylglycerol kinase, catalytic domain n=1 Tax=Dillenia turbinata TaxID=194707 RepID=A0AAN8W0I0_9MAGN